jgi:hypothetical protein
VKITEPGCYSISFEDYLGDTCDGVSISSHGLAHFLTKEDGGTATPAHWWAYSHYNPNREEDTATRALDVGRAAHALVLGEPEFARYFAVLPYDDLRKAEAKAWKAGMEEQGKTVIRASDLQMIQRMTAAVKRSPQVGNAFIKGRSEMSLIWRVKINGVIVWVKSRPDWLPDDLPNGWILDFKAHADIEPGKFARDAFAYNYHLQAAMQRQAVREVLKVEPLGVAHVVQEKQAPYLTELRMFRPTALDYGQTLFSRALVRFAGCWAKHIAGAPERAAWPGYTTEASYIEEPYTVAKRIEEDGNDHDQVGDADYVLGDAAA